ncbi:MAG: DUF2202 domain-containing protein [Gammaproteobacteria bacterium]|jgi:hypothetical protein
MGNLNKSIIAGFSALTIVLSICPASATDAVSPASSDDTATLDFNEKTHLIFMCEEEKLARDTYITLGARYPEAAVFGRIDDSEERHKCAVADMLEKYEIPNPSTNDNVGVFTGEDYGWYFTEKFNALVERGSVSVLEALYVGAFIEELDMLDINQCPQVIVETDNGINDVSECGKVYTDNADILRLYGSLLEGSESHLRAYVSNIEKQIGEGNYVAQVLTQEQVDTILGR